MVGRSPLRGGIEAGSQNDGTMDEIGDSPCYVPLICFGLPHVCPSSALLMRSARCACGKTMAASSRLKGRHGGPNGISLVEGQARYRREARAHDDAPPHFYARPPNADELKDPSWRPHDGSGLSTGDAMGAAAATRHDRAEPATRGMSGVKRLGDEPCPPPIETLVRTRRVGPSGRRLLDCRSR